MSRTPSTRHNRATVLIPETRESLDFLELLGSGVYPVPSGFGSDGIQLWGCVPVVLEEGVYTAWEVDDWSEESA